MYALRPVDLLITTLRGWHAIVSDLITPSIIPRFLSAVTLLCLRYSILNTSCIFTFLPLVLTVFLFCNLSTDNVDVNPSPVILENGDC